MKVGPKKIAPCREDVINLLGGPKCEGLQFIGGLPCPIPSKHITMEDICIGHRQPNGAVKEIDQYTHRKRWFAQIFAMRNPNKKYVTLCNLCNGRMRFLTGEFCRYPLPRFIIKMYEEGDTQREIAKDFKCSPQTIGKALKNYNTFIYDDSDESSGGTTAWSCPLTRKQLLHERLNRFNTPKRRQNARKMYALWEDGLSLREVAEFFGTTHPAICAHLKLIGEYVYKNGMGYKEKA